MLEHDAVIIGAGYAGITAARDLRERGRSALVLEARNRIGGRTHSRPFRGHGQITIEAGGAYIAPRLQPNIRREIERYATPVTSLEGTVENICFINGGQRRTRLFLPVEDLEAFERVVVYTSNAAKRINTALPLAAQRLTDLDVSIEEFFAPLELSRAMTEFVTGMIGGYSAADPAQISMLHMLAWIAGCGGSLYDCFIAAFETKFQNGTGELINAMADDAGVAVMLETPVTEVIQEVNRIRVRTGRGDEHAAEMCVVAVPTNTLKRINFVPAMSERKAEALQREHQSRGVKRFFLVRGAPPGFLGISGYLGKGLTRMQWLFEDAPASDGVSLMVGFSVDPTFNSPSLEEAQAAVAEFLPDATVLATDHNDWTNDPYSLGIIRVNPPGTMMKFAHIMNQPEGRIVFAGSDIAEIPFSGAWMEGAVHSGHEAAHRIDTFLSAHQRRGSGG